MSDTTDFIQQTPELHYEGAACDYFRNDLCRSCELLGTPGGDRVSKKLALLGEALAAHRVEPRHTHPIVLPSHPWQSRAKIKMAVGGDNSAPIIGLVTLDKPAVDLVECPLTPEPVRQLLRAVRELIRSQKLSPYDIATRVGELKHVIVMTSADHSQAIVRFVLRSSEALPRIRKSVNHLQTLFPWVKVISCNIQPKPAAILEGPEEIILTAEQVISEHFGEIALFLAPQSFMQVTPEVARALYAQAAHYIKLEQPQLVLDLFCGVGGFSLHAARHATHVTGVELSSAATECAQRGAKHLHLSNTQFHAADVESFLNTYDNAYPDVVIVNPPRRGLSSRILSQLLRLQPRMILYSSCAPETFARDAQLLNPSYILEELTPFDMFPMTLHCELLGRFIRAS